MTLLAANYQIDRELGRGGMATVYLARDLRHDRQVAIKVVHPDLAAVIGAERFLAEIRTTANLQHPHILPLFDSGQADGQLFYVMPYIAGETLRARLERETQLPVADTIRIASEVADALQYAHARGVIHRDIKPENILLQDGHALVADFGIALAVTNAGGNRITQTGISLGTPQYMSPEQATGARNVDARTDIYSLGAVTYEMLAGEPPFTGPNAQAVIAQVITGEAAPVIARRPSVPPHVSDTVRTALEKLPADRFASAVEFANALSNPALGANIRRGIEFQRPRSVIALPLVAVAVLAVGAWAWTKVASSRTSGAGTSSPSWLATLALPDSAMPTGPFSLARDGARLVYAARGPHGTQIWIRDADAVDPRPIAGTDSAAYPAISPDGKRVAFLVGHSLRTVGVAGGPVTTVIDTLSTFSLFDWADDDHLLISARTGITRVPLHGGAWEPVTKTDPSAGEVFHTGPSPLPDGRTILFIVVPRNYGDNSRFAIAVSEPGTMHHKILIPGFWARYVEPGYLLVVRPDSALVAVPFDASRRRITGNPVVLAAGTTVEQSAFPEVAVAGTGQLVLATGGPRAPRLGFARVKRDGSTSALIDSSWSGNVRGLSLSRDGQRLASVVSLGTWDLQIRDLRTGASSVIAMSGRVADDAAFSVDGGSLFFATNNADSGVIHQVRIGGATTPTTVVRDTVLSLREPAPSPDGKTLYYVRRRGAISDIMAHSLDQPGTSDRPVVVTTSRESSPAVSPNGLWLAYASDESGHAEVYVRSTDPSRSERWQVSHNVASSPRWSHDGRELFYLGRDSMMVAEITAPAEMTLGARRALFSMARFGTRPQQFDVLPGNDGFVMLEKRDEPRGTAKIVFVEHWRGLMTPRQ